MKKALNFQVFSSFLLKILALFCMTVDHTGLLIGEYFTSSNDNVVIAMRIIGRLALPLFCFMISEGAIYTKSKKKYFLRLFSMAAIISIALLIINSFIFNVYDYGNIFLDLTLGALACFALSSKKKTIKLTAILPIGFSILSYIVKYMEMKEGILINWFPYFLRLQYDFYSVGMIVMLFLAKIIASEYLKYHAKLTGLDVESLKGSSIDRMTQNLLSVFAIIIATLFYVVLSKNISFPLLDVQFNAILAIVPVMLYNGNKGYSSKIFELSCYLYYPIHIVILYGLFMLLTM